MSIRNCARCGGDHTNIEAQRLERPMAPPELSFAWTHWAPCPTNGQPIMIIVTKDKGQDIPLHGVKS